MAKPWAPTSDLISPGPPLKSLSRSLTMLAKGGGDNKGLSKLLLPAILPAITREPVPHANPQADAVSDANVCGVASPAQTPSTTARVKDFRFCLRAAGQVIERLDGLMGRKPLTVGCKPYLQGSRGPFQQCTLSGWQ